MTGLEFVSLLLLGAAAGILFVFLVADLPLWRARLPYTSCVAGAGDDAGVSAAVALMSAATKLPIRASFSPLAGPASRVTSEFILACIGMIDSRLVDLTRCDELADAIRRTHAAARCSDMVFPDDVSFAGKANNQKIGAS
jgi:hypothetical protein